MTLAVSLYLDFEEDKTQCKEKDAVLREPLFASESVSVVTLPHLMLCSQGLVDKNYIMFQWCHIVIADICA